MIVLLAGFLPSGTPYSEKEVLLVSQQGGMLGSQGLNYQHIELGDHMVLAKGVEGSPLLTQTGPIEVAKGVITAEEHLVEFSIPSTVIDDLSSASLDFVVSDTNGHGPLIITLNGQEVWSDYVEAGQAVEVELPVSEISDSNSIRITAGSSGWRIWSPTYYILENLQVKEQLISSEERTFEFQLSDAQLKNFYKGRVYMGNVKPTIRGEMAVILNEERVVFRGVPGRGAVINSFSSGVKADNTVTFRMIENGYYEMFNIEIIVFTSANATAGFSTDFTIPLEDLSRMREGREEGVVEIEVLKSADKPLEVVLAGEKDTALYRKEAEEGTLSLKFTGYEAARDNTLTIRSAGEYSLGNVEVKLVRK